MVFFLDENFPRRASSILVENGNKAIDIRGTELEGIDDVEIFKIAQKYKAVFLTTDRDFYHTIPYKYPDHFGIIVVALSRPDAKSICDKLKIGLSYISKNSMAGRCILFTDSKIIVHPHP